MNFRLAVTFLQFPIQVFFLHFHFSISRLHPYITGLSVTLNYDLSNVTETVSCKPNIEVKGRFVRTLLFGHTDIRTVDRMLHLNH